VTTTPGKPIVGLRAILPMFMAMMALAFFITFLFGPNSLLTVVAAGTSAGRQVGWGIVIGLAIALPAWAAILNIRAFAAFRDQMLALADRIDLRGSNPLWIGLCAGVGEEALCRGALQPLLGIWWTSVLFTLAHYRTGGFRSMTLTKCGYAGFVFLASVLMGYVLIELGLIAAAVAHSAVDVVGIVMLRSEVRRRMRRSVEQP
jgi:membrane protease YdiL (CAAX protease family)